jgi:hypothetical protein
MSHREVKDMDCERERKTTSLAVVFETRKNALPYELEYTSQDGYLVKHDSQGK